MNNWNNFFLLNINHWLAFEQGKTYRNLISTVNVSSDPYNDISSNLDFIAFELWKGLE